MYVYRARAVKVVDGDTCDFEVDLGFSIRHTIRVRLHGIDTPELHARTEEERTRAIQAQAFVIDHLMPMGQPVPWVMISTQKDKIGIYGRYTATVLLPGDQDLCTLLKEAGLEKRERD